MSAPRNLWKTGAAISQSPAERYVPVAKSDTDLVDGPCRALLVGTAGTATLMQIDGTIRANVPLVQGLNPLACKQVRTGGTAADIWALY